MVSQPRPPAPRFLRRRRSAKRRRRPRYPVLAFFGRLILAAIKLGLLVTLTAVAGVMWIYYSYSRDLPDPHQISEYRSFETTRIYARDGTTMLYELIGPQAGRRTPVLFEQIPPFLKQATIAVEDAGFYTNPGVDIRGIVRAALQNYRSGEIVSGASTITMQLVRNILLDPNERSEQSYERKLREAILAYQVSRTYGKDQILNLYLNEVYYGAQAYGVEAAAQSYFSKHVWELTPAEASLIAGLPQSPSNYDPFQNMAAARARQRVTLNAMVAAGFLTRSEADRIFAEPITLNPPQSAIKAAHWVFYVRDLLERRYGPDVLYRAGLKVVTTLDPQWQAEAERVVSEQIAGLRQRNATNAGVIILSRDGQILAMVGSADYNAPDGQVNVTLAPRQPGSALKPFVYAAALQRGWTPATVIWDTPSRWVNADGIVYEPMNYDDSFHGPMRLRMALANSLNIPAVKALEHVGVANFVELMSRLGIGTFNNPERFGLAMALGSNEVRLLDLTNAYNTLSNSGRYRAPAVVLQVTNSRGEVLDRWAPDPGLQVLGPQGEQIAYLISDILSDDQARRFMFGANNVLEIADLPVAAKTGTSNDFRDSWALGYTSEATIGVWVGNNDSSPMSEVAGSNGAGQIWRELMLRYHSDRAALPFAIPSGVEQIEICADTGGLAGPGCPRRVSELFVAGTAPSTPDIGMQVVKVGGDGNCLATDLTPPDQVREVQYPRYPPEFAEWAARNAPQPPTRPCAPPANIAVQIANLNPIGASGIISGNQVSISGTARGPFVLEVGAGSSPAEWRVITSNTFSVQNGLLGVWATSDLPNGEYMVRLRVTAMDGQELSASQLVQVRR